MELIIDIGNSNVVFGVYSENQWKNIWRMPTIKGLEMQFFYQKRLLDLLLENKINASDIDRVAVSSVVPDLDQHFQMLISDMFDVEAQFLTLHSVPDFTVDTDNPSELGNDLLANAIAAYHFHKKTCVIVDFGTALTFTVVSAQKEIIGVAIAPGLSTALKSLHGDTAQLPEVVPKLPQSVLGKTTTQAIQAGVCWGYIGLVQGILKKIETELAGKTIRIATGGLSSALEPIRSEFHEINPHLTLEGIRIGTMNNDAV